MTTTRTKRRRLRVSVKGFRCAIVVSSFNPSIANKLLRGAQDCLRAHHVPRSRIKTYSCPGAFELPQVARALVKIARWDAVICLGAVIRGETPHFEYIAAEAARGIQQVALQSGTPVVFGVLTTDTEQQAHERAGGTHGNRGWDAAVTAMEMAALFKRIEREEGR